MTKPKDKSERKQPHWNVVVLVVIAIVILITGIAVAWRANDGSVYSSMPWPKVCDEFEDKKEVSVCQHVNLRLISNHQLGLTILGAMGVSTALILFAILVTRKKD